MYSSRQREEQVESVEIEWITKLGLRFGPSTVNRSYVPGLMRLGSTKSE